MVRPYHGRHTMCPRRLNTSRSRSKPWPRPSRRLLLSNSTVAAVSVNNRLLVRNRSKLRSRAHPSMSPRWTRLHVPHPQLVPDSDLARVMRWISGHDSLPSVRPGTLLDCTTISIKSARVRRVVFLLPTRTTPTSVLLSSK